MKKLNALIAMVLSVAAPIHAVSFSGCAMGVIPYFPMLNKIGWATLVLFSIHTILSICISFFCNEQSNVMQYCSLNRSTIIQRVSAVIMMVLIHAHFIGGFFGKSGPPAQPLGTILLILELGLLIAICLHIAVSVPKAIVTLGGLQTEKALKLVTIVSYIVASLAGLFSFAATIVYAF